jgi:hypothetical protein
MGGACSTDAGEMRKGHKSLAGQLKGRDHLEDLGVGEKNVNRMDHREIGCEGVDLIQLAQYRVQWRVLMNAVMNFLFP